MSYIADELRELRKENVRLNRRLALQRIPGRVAERDTAKRTVRLEIGEDPDTGEKILSPPVRVQSVGAGRFKGFIMPADGEQMYLESPSGVVGADSVATFGAFDDETPPPDADPDETVLSDGEVKVRIKGDRVRLERGERFFESTETGWRHKGPMVQV
jgi:hypothetical protein